MSWGSYLNPGCFSGSRLARTLGAALPWSALRWAWHGVHMPWPWSVCVRSRLSASVERAVQPLGVQRGHPEQRQMGSLARMRRRWAGGKPRLLPGCVDQVTLHPRTRNETRRQGWVSQH